MIGIESKDILNYTIAFCILWITVFLCYAMYYMIAMLKKLNDSLNVFQVILTSINALVGHAKEKLIKSFTGFEFLGMLMKKIIEKVGDAKEKKNSKTKSQKK